jgi:signal peptidase II
VRRHGAWVTALIAAVVLLADQVSKALVRTYLAPTGVSVPIVGDLVRFTFTRNEGAAFGLLPGSRVLFIPIHIIVLVCIAGYLVRRRPHSPWLIAALGLVAGGAMGNLIDRTVVGWVTDFVQVPFNFPVFNVADSAIVVGVAMLVWWLLFGPAPAGEAEALACEPGAPAGETAEPAAAVHSLPGEHAASQGGSSPEGAEPRS